MDDGSLTPANGRDVPARSDVKANDRKSYAVNRWCKKYLLYKSTVRTILIMSSCWLQCSEKCPGDAIPVCTELPVVLPKASEDRKDVESALANSTIPPMPDLPVGGKHSAVWWIEIDTRP
jgi:hypothetical protein